MRSRTVIFVNAVLALSCSANQESPPTHIIVIGAGIAGLSAALEASHLGARVTVVEKASVGGGHAVRAAGFSLVGTPLQAENDIQDTPDLAYQDMLAWGEDVDTYWVRRFVDESRTEVYDWLTGLGVEFAFVVPAPEDSVPRFHFTRGAAVNAVVPMLAAALNKENIDFLWNSEVTGLLEDKGSIAGVMIRDTRTGKTLSLSAGGVVLATGGFQTNMNMVRSTWPVERSRPERLLVGSGQFANGDGIEFTRSVDAQRVRMDRHVTYINGLPDPRDPRRALLVQNPRTIWVNAEGLRFVNEAASRKEIEAALFKQSSLSHWLIFDARGREQMTIRGTAWLNPETIADEIFGNPELVSREDSLKALAQAAELPGAALRATVEDFNSAGLQNTDPAFGRFPSDGHEPFTVAEPPFYAMQLYPMTRKSMGGLAIDHEARVQNQQGEPVPGLYAAGEVTGVAGINGRHGGSGTFLGPSVLLGRIAGRTAASHGTGQNAAQLSQPGPGQPSGNGTSAADRADTVAAPVAMNPATLQRILEQGWAGYWHFQVSHELVLEQSLSCTQCHSSAWPTAAATTRAHRLAQLESCTHCH